MTVTVNFQLDLSQLTTRAQCDTVTVDLTFDRKTFLTRDANIDLADERADRRVDFAEAALGKLDAEIVRVQTLLANPGSMNAEAIQDLTDDLELLQAQRKKLVKRTKQVAGPAQFLGEVSAAKVDGQVAVLNAIIDAVTAHRATLPV